MADFNLARLRIILEAESSKLQSELEVTNKKIDEFGRRSDASFKKFSNGLKNTLAGVGISQITRYIVDTTADFETLSASLRTVTGSADAATVAFSFIKDFALTTPYSIKEVTDAFIKLKSFGLDPSEDALRSYGNTASAVGKKLDQFVSAVAVAITGQFDRLEEFGIDATRQGNKIAFTFQNVTKTVGNSATEIEGYLRDIGKNQFADGLSEQMDTLDGKISTLKNSVALLADAFNKSSGLNEGLKFLTAQLTEAADFWEAYFKSATGFEEQIRKIKDLDLELKTLERHKESVGEGGFLSKWMYGSQEDIDQKIEETKSKIRALTNEVLNANKAVIGEETSPDFIGPPRPPKKPPPTPPDTKAAKKAEELAQRFREKFNPAEQIEASLAEADKLLAKRAISWDTYAASVFDAIDTENAAIEKSGEIGNKAQEALDKLAESVRQSVNPMDDLEAKVADLDMLLEKGAITWDTYAEAFFNATDSVDSTFDKTIDKTKDVNDAAADMGYAFQSAFEDAVLEGKGLQDILKGLLQDIEKVILRQTITAPLGQAVAGGAASLIPSLFAAAEGTDSAPGGLTLVGERGPEMALPPRIGRQLISEVGWKFAPVSAPKMPGQVAGIQWQSDMPRIPGIPGQVAGIDWQSDAFKPNEIEDQGASVKWRLASIDIPSPAAQTIPIGWRVAPMPSLGLPATHDTGFKFSNDRVQEVALPPLMVGGRTIQLKAPSFGSMAMPKLPNLPMLSALGDYKIVGKDGPEIVNLPRGSQVVPNHILKTGRIWDWLNIPHFASGTTFAPGGVSLVGESGSELVKLPGSKGSASGGTVVNVINNTNQTATVQRSNGSDGREMINVIIGEIDRRISAGGSTGRIIERKYGLRTNPIGRT